MAASIVDRNTNSDTYDTAHTYASYSAGAGSNRLVVAIIMRQYTGETVSTVEWGTSTLANGKIVLAESYLQTTGIEMYYVKEADLQNGSNFVVTLSGAQSARLVIYTLAGVDQTTPLSASVDLGNGNPVESLSGSITNPTDGVVVMGWCCRTTVTNVAPTGGLTERYDSAVYTDINFWVGDTTTAGSVDCGLAWTTAKVNAGVAAAFSPSSGGTGIALPWFTV